MAYAALVSLSQTIDLILNHDKCSISGDEKEKILSTREYVIFLTSFLEDFPEKAYRLEGKIRDAAEEAEYIIEYFVWKRVRTSWWTIGLSRVEFEHHLKKIREQIGSIAGELMEDRLGKLTAAISSSRIEYTGKSDVVIGLDDDLIAIKSQLCGESSKLQVIPIVGMGGIGKTTLAWNAYNDPLIVECFHIRAWVTVSQDYSVQGILLSLVDSMKLFEEQSVEQKNDLCDEQEILSLPNSTNLFKELMERQRNKVVTPEKVYKHLKGRRYLIVMDDVWSTKAWDDVRNIFPNDNNGSRIMLTTRLSSVAAYAKSGSPFHEMKFMDENQSWNLLKQKAFTNDSGPDCPPELEYVGKGIAQSCRGLPIAIVLVAGILSTVTKTRDSWEEIGKNVNSIVDGQLENILSLSYTHLPHHLRPCFLFIGGIPGNYEIHVSRLIKLWVAEGFLRCQNGYKTLEEEAEEYLEDLVKRNLVLVTSRKINGKIKACSLHDLVRDLCIRKAHQEKFLHVMDGSSLPKSIKGERRVINIYYNELYYLSPNIHKIVCFQQDCSSLAFLGSFRLLRVLDILHYRGVLLPLQMFELFHLRYLAIGNYIKIPSAISNLENLQTLIIRPRMGLLGYRPVSSYLPFEIWRMSHLRHLVFTDFYMLLDPGDRLTLPLKNLQTLSVVASLVCSKRILKMIPNLKKLGIIYFRKQEHQLHNLMCLHHLEKLKITISQSFSWQGQNLVFPRTLKKLTLVGGRLSWKDMTVIGSLPNLEVLKLIDHACEGNTWETTDGEFPQLKFLLIKESCLKCWITESSHFPRLMSLVLHCCEHLKQIPDSFGDISTLELIEVDDLNKSLVKSAKQIQDDQRSYGNDALQVRCIHSDQIRRSRYVNF